MRLGQVAQRCFDWKAALPLLFRQFGGVGKMSNQNRRKDMQTERTAAIAAAYPAAWTKGSTEALGWSYAPEEHLIINRGTPWEGRAGLAAMAAGFLADALDLNFACDGPRQAAGHAAYVWTVTFYHVQTRNPLRIMGWVDWGPDAEGKVAAPRGWSYAEDFARQVAA